MQGVSLRNFVAVQPVASPAEVRGLGIDGVVWRAIDRVRRRVSVSPRRIYLVGSGAAGTDAFRVACRHSRDFAGVVSLGGLFPLDEGAFAGLAGIRRLPMLLCCSFMPRGLRWRCGSTPLWTISRRRSSPT
jgi:poly(3-hydroxybutyrate) depolymerase